MWLNKNIRESQKTNDWDWVESTNPTLDNYFNSGLLNTGDKLWLRGYTEDGDGLVVYLDGVFTITKSSTRFLTSVRFNVNDEIKSLLGVTEIDPTFIHKDGDLEVYRIQNVNENKELDESLNWSDKDTINWDKDKLFNSQDPSFSPDANWTTSPERSYWVQGSTGGSSESGPGSSGEGETMDEEDELEFGGDFDWAKDVEVHPNYNGHPQGIVYLYNHDEIDEFCNIIENYNGGELPRGNARTNLHNGLELRRDELEGEGYDISKALLSVSFFVETNKPGLLSVGYWNYRVTDDEIYEWLEDDSYTFNNEYELYVNLNQVKKVFENYQNPELMKESIDSDWDWVNDMSDPVPFELAEIGKKYRVEVEDELLHALEACGEYDDIFTRSFYVVVDQKREMPHRDIFCNSGTEDEVLGLQLSFFDSDEGYIDFFWVTQEMLNLFEIV